MAESLVKGRGFSDPFGIPSGPTAWMPPAPVALVAAEFLIFGVRTPAALWCALTLKCLGLAASVYLLLGCLDDGRLYRWRYAAALAFVAVMGALPDFFLDLHDIWLVVLLALALVRCFVPLMERRGDAPRMLMLALSVIAPMTSPALVPPFLALWGWVLFRAWRQRHECRGEPQSRVAAAQFRLGAASLLLCIGSLLAWSAVTASRTGMVAPVKSNMWYDFYQANALEGDGLLRVSTFYRYHPIHSPAVLERYVQEGEKAFMDWHRQQSMDFLRREPRQFLARVARRASNAFVFLRPTDDVWEVDADQLDEGDVACLAAAGVIALDRHQSTAEAPLYLWTNLSDTPERFSRYLAWLGPLEPEAIFEQWRFAGSEVVKLHRDARTWLRGFALAGLPSIALLLGLCDQGIRRDSVFRVSAVVYLGFLAPYVLISHYARYQMFMLGVQALVVSFGFVAGWRLARRVAGRAA
ncbi:MAG: hypothetical protein ABR961_08520 [Thermoanaerobaculaceae bacterium]